MRTTIVSNLLLGAGIFASVLLAPESVSAADFDGPSGWTRTDVPSPSPTRSIATFQIAGDTSTSITFIQDSTVSYVDTVAAMNKNFSENSIRLATNKDIPCQGTTAHVVEFTSGPDSARTIFNRLVVPIGTGVATITYTRADGNAFEGDVRKAEQAFCAQTPSVTPDPGILSAPSPTLAPSPAASG